jgi:hypothetical protein
VADGSDIFGVPAAPTGGSTLTMADDSTVVPLKDVLLMSEASSAGNGYAGCWNFGTACLSPTTMSLPASVLQSGANKLEFEGAHRERHSLELEYLGSVIDPVSTPEPASVLMLGIGLLALSGIALGRNRMDS